MMYQEIYNQITGEIRSIAKYDDKGNVVNVNCEWLGGDVVGITEELLNNLDPRFASRDGDSIQYGPYKLKIVAKLQDVPGYGSIVLARRVYA